MAVSREESIQLSRKDGRIKKLLEDIFKNPFEFSESLKQLKELLKDSPVIANGKAGIDCFNRLVSLGGQDLPRGIFLSFEPGRAVMIEEAREKRRAITRWARLMDDATQSYVSTLNQLLTALSGDLNQKLSKVWKVCKRQKKRCTNLGTETFQCWQCP